MTGQKKKRRESGQKVTVRLWTQAVKALRILSARAEKGAKRKLRGKADMLVSAGLLLLERESVNGFSCCCACPSSGCQCQVTIEARQRALDEQRAVQAQKAQPPNTGSIPQSLRSRPKPDLRLV